MCEGLGTAALGKDVTNEVRSTQAGALKVPFFCDECEFLAGCPTALKEIHSEYCSCAAIMDVTLFVRM